MTKADLYFNDDDRAYMKMALDLARRGLGRVYPNPAVGCILVKDRRIIGRGWTGAGGRPHAESNALKNAVCDAAGATAYVSLEPCAHYGQTPPCADALIKAKISRVIIATDDPDSRVNGKGAKMLEKAGIKVELGLLQQQAKSLNLGFFQRISMNKPMVTIKIASSSDGKIATIKDEKSWITGPQSRMRGHLYRANHDAIMIGINTAMIDDPMLDCRLPGLEGRSPIRVVIDTHLKLPLESKLCKSAHIIPLWIITCSSNSKIIKAFEMTGVKVYTVKSDLNNQVDLKAALNILSDEGITRLLSEGGSQLNASLIKASLVDKLIWFKSSDFVGDDGVDALNDMAMDQLDQYIKLTTVDEGTTGSDHWQEFEKIN